MIQKDLALILKAMNGDEESFGEITQIYGNVILGLIYTFCRDSEMAKDLTQETFLKAFIALPNLQNPHKFSSWLKQIAVNHTKEYLRKKNRIVYVDEFFESEWNLVDQQNVEENVEEIFRIKEIASIVEKLPAGVREVITLQYMEGLTPAEIAEKLHLKRSALDTRLSRGREQLKKLLTESNVRNTENPVENYLVTLAEKVKKVLKKEKMERIVAAKELALLAARANLERLYQDLSSYNDSTRQKAAKLIGDTGDRRAEDVLNKCLIEEEIPSIQADICRALVRIGSVKSIQTINEVTKRSADVVLHKVATESIKALKEYTPHQNDIPVTIKQLKEAGIENLFIGMIDNQDAKVRVHAFDGLGRVESAKALKKLLACLEKEKEDYMKVVILEALGGIMNKRRNNKENISKLLHKKAVSTLTHFLSYSHQGVVAEAARTLSLMDLKGQEETIKLGFYQSIEKLKNIPGPWWVTFPEMLREIDDEELLMDVMTIVKDEETRFPRPFSLIVESMIKPGMDRAIHPIQEAIERGIETEILIRALVKSNHPTVLPIMNSWLKDNHSAKKQLVEGMIQISGGKNELKEYIYSWMISQTQTEDVIRHAISVIASNGRKEDISFLDNLSQNPHLSKRAQNLARLGSVKLKRELTAGEER